MKRIILPLLLMMLESARLCAQPVITNHPVNQAVVWGGNAIFSVMATGVGPLTYQWQLNGTNLPNNIISTYAGNGTSAFSGDDSLATNASLYLPWFVLVDASGKVF